MNDGVEPIFVSVVRLRTYAKGDNAPTKHSKRPYLLMLTPDQLQLFTTKDASLDTLETAATSTIDAPTLQSNESTAKRRVVLPILGGKPRRSILQQQGDDQQQQQKAVENGSDSPKDTAPDAEDQLQDDQVFKLGVSLNQIMGVECPKDHPDRLTVSFQPNRPSKRSTFEVQTMGLLRGLMGSFSYSGSKAVHDAQAHHFTIQLLNAEEAVELKGKIYKAQETLAQAVAWIAEGFPFLHDSTITMLTITSPPPPSSQKKSPFSSKKNATNTNNNDQSTTTNSSSTLAAQPAFIIPSPCFGANIVLPESVSDALVVSSSSKKSQTVIITVYLNTPLGPAIADIPVIDLHRSAAEGGSPLTTIARIQTTSSVAQDGGNRRQQGEEVKGSRKSVILHFRAERGDLLPYLNSPSFSGEQHGESNAPNGQNEDGLEGVGGNSPRGRSPTRGSPTVVDRDGNRRELQVLRNDDGKGGVAVFALGLASSLARKVRNKLGQGDGTQLTPVTSTALQRVSERYRWHLILLQAEAVEEHLVPRLPLVQRTLSMSGGDQRPVLATAQIPPCVEMLVKENSDVLTIDVAQRFLVGLGSESKAYTAMLNLVSYTREQNLVNILTRPQPAFSIMKQHYQHGVLGWSKKKDCLVELEATGNWPNAYEKIRAAGVTDNDMLEHLLFIQKYNFTYGDPRPWPQGKTVRIVDLDGLQMSCLRSDAFKLISKVGALLGAQSPQRLHVCFFLNAPSWWSLAWNIVSPMIPAKVRKHMKMYNRSQLKEAKTAMLEWVDEVLLPAAYGGLNSTPLNESEFEQKLVEYVAGLSTTSTHSDGNKDGDVKNGEKAVAVMAGGVEMVLSGDSTTLLSSSFKSAEQGYDDDYVGEEVSSS